LNRLLLDTHAFLWWLAESPKLRRDARTAIADSTALVHVSAVTIWEIAIKAQLGRLDPGTERIDSDGPQHPLGYGLREDGSGSGLENAHQVKSFDELFVLLSFIGGQLSFVRFGSELINPALGL
jgi:hypothetical protein